MGAWDYGIFDDDTAYDALYDLETSKNIMNDMEKYLDEVIKADYVGYDECHYALVSAAVIDSIINGTSYRCDDSYTEWIETLKELDVTPLKKKTIQAIDRVLSDHSELKELWEENKKLYTSWQNDKRKIQKRLMK